MIEVKSSIEDVDREFENSKVKVVVIRVWVTVEL